MTETQANGALKSEFGRNSITAEKLVLRGVGTTDATNVMRVINENPGASRTVDYLVKAFVDGTDPRQLTRALGQHLRDITNEQDGPAWRLANEVAKLLEAEAEGHQPALVQ